MMLIKKGYYVVLLALVISACSNSEEAPTQNNQPKTPPVIEAPVVQSEPEPYQLPKRPDTPEPILTIADVKAMTSPDQLAKALVAPDAQVRLAAVQALSPYATNLPDVALQRLINMLDADQDKTIVKEVALLLSKTCHPAVMVMLFNNLKRDTNNINIEALTVLGDIAGYRAVEKIDELLERLADDQSSVAQQIQPVAQEAKSKIMARNGKPLMCSW